MMKMGKIVIIILLIMLLISNFSIVNASEKLTASDILNKADGFLDKGRDEHISDESIKKLSTTIYNILLVIGIVAAIIVGIIIGIKYIIGTIDEKAEVKGMLVVYVIGCIIVFGAFGIWSAVVNVLQ